MTDQPAVSTDAPEIAPAVRDVLLHAQHEITALRQRLAELEPKAEAYEALVAVINRLQPVRLPGASVDVAWRISTLLAPFND